MKITILLLLIWAAPFISLAKESNISTESIETVTQDNAVLKGTRWVNEGKPRILLVHGFSENTNIFFDLALSLQKAGYDVFAFNFRGHGNDHERSLVEGAKPKANHKNGAYGFDRVITQDMPAMIDFVYDGKPIVVLGHSLGGASLRLFLSGVRDYGEGLYLTRDDRKLDKYLSKVKSLINVGTPTSFQKSDFRYRIWTKLPDSLTNLMLQPIMRKYLGEYVFSGLINMENIKNQDRLFAEGFSLIPADLIQDVQRWAVEKFQSRTYFSDDRVQYEGLKVPEKLKFFQIVGSKDHLVPPKEIINEHEEYRITEKPQVVLMKSFGHIDLVYDQKSAKILTPMIDEIYKSERIEDSLSKDTKVLKPKISFSCSKLFNLKI